jgi:hypothetical protein
MKVSDLTGAQLDYWVAKAQGWIKTRSQYDDKPLLWDTGGGFYRIEGVAGAEGDERWRPSTWWGHGGPIIEREQIAIYHDYEHWLAVMPGAISYPGDVDHDDVTAVFDGHGGPTPLIAAMRAFVASKFGEEVPDV